MIKFDFQRANHAHELHRWAAAANLSIGEAVRDEMRLVLTACVRRTPPFSGADLRRMVGSDITGNAKQVGEKAVERDVRKVFRPVSGLDLFSDNEGFRRAVFAGDKKEVEKFLKGASNYRGVVDSADESAMLENRIRRGRVGRFPKWRATLSSLPGQRLADSNKADVGRAKAGWGTACAQFGVKLPRWVTKHREPGAAVDQTSRPVGKIVASASNGVPWIQATGRELAIVTGALREREKALEAKVRRAVQNPDKIKK